MNTPVCILTGASRGLGAAIARQLVARGTRLLTLSRRPDASLDGPLVEQWEADLAAPAAVTMLLEDWIAKLALAEVESLTLINNAAALTPPGPLSAAEDADLVTALRVGLEAPTLLTAAFLRASANCTAPRRVLNISSGLGRSAMAGSASYCAVKAGLDHLSRAVALEEAEKPNGARIVSLAPGVIDTDMQVQLRSADPATFKARERFAGLKANGQLDSPEAAAAKVLAFLDRADFGSDPIGDVRGG